MDLADTGNLFDQVGDLFGVFDQQPHFKVLVGRAVFLGADVGDIYLVPSQCSQRNQVGGLQCRRHGAGIDPPAIYGLFAPGIVSRNKENVRNSLEKFGKMYFNSFILVFYILPPGRIFLFYLDFTLLRFLILPRGFIIKM